MESIELQVEPRENAGKGAARRLRREGKVPAILYGPKREPTPLAVDAKEFSVKSAQIRGSVLVRLSSSHAEIGDCLALVKEVQRAPVSGALLHADFYEVDMKSKLRVRVPLEFVGKAVGLDQGGILQPVLREVEVECLPTDIPPTIGVDVASLAIHDVLHLSDVRPPEGVDVLFDSDEPVVTVLAPVVDEVKTESAEGEEAEGEESSDSSTEPAAKE